MLKHLAVNEAHVERIYVRYQYRDAKGELGQTEISFPLSTDITVLRAFAINTAFLIDTLTKCQITGIHIGLTLNPLEIAGLKTAPIMGADCEEGALFTWHTTNSYLTNFRIPGFDETFVDGEDRLIVLTAPDVAAFIQRITDGYTATLINVSPSDVHGDDIVRLLRAREHFQTTRF